jgi:predicted amidohydrolase YtcJ
VPADPGPGAGPDPGSALALVNGRVRASAAGPAAEAILIRGPYVAALGSTAAIRAAAAPGTTVLDLAGRAVLPAITDSHTHFHRAAQLQRHFLDFTALAPGSVAAVLAAVRQRAASQPDELWIQGDNLSADSLAERRLPTRRELDQAGRGHPVVLRTVGKHGIAASSAALAAAAITRDTPDPPGGRIERDDQGEPTGVLHERAKLRLDATRADTVIPPLAEARRLDALAHGLAELNRLGITEIHEIVQSPDELADYSRLREQGLLTTRVVCYVRVIEGQATLGDLTRLGLRTGFGDDWLRIGGVKVSIDGSCTLHNAAVYGGYRDQPGNDGLIRVEQGELDELLAGASRHGLQVAVHAIGQRAVDMALAAIGRAGPAVAAGPAGTAGTAGPGRGPAGLRHRIEHAYLAPRPGQLERCRDLGVVVSTQPSFLWANGDTWPAMFGPAEAARMMPVRSLLDLGIPAQLNTDFPNAPLDPLLTLRSAVGRRTRAGTVLGPGEAVTPRQAWALATEGAAFGAFEEHRRGRLGPGHLADLIVLSGDPFTLSEDLTVDATVAGGRFVHGRDTLG